MSDFDVASLGWWTFNQTLQEEIFGNDFSANGLYLPSYKKYTKYDLLNQVIVNKYGLLFAENESYTADIGSFEGDEYTAKVGFTYYSAGVLGYTKHVITKEKTPLVAPIIAKCDISTTDVETPTTGEWVVTEVGHSDTQNKMILTVINTDGYEAISIESKPYEVGLHSFFVTVAINGGVLYIRLDLDAVVGQQVIRDNFTMLTNTASSLSINKVALGYTAHKTVNTGSYISDLCAIRVFSSYGIFCEEYARFGGEAIVKSGLPKYQFLGIGFSQPTTVSTNQIFVDGGNIYAARSDGEILKGNRPIWDNEFLYENPDDVNRLLSNKTGTNPTWSENGVILSGTTIRI